MSVIPPPEHRDIPYHWLNTPGGTPLVAEWMDFSGDWAIIGTETISSPELLANCGWRYIAPAIPPNEGETS